MRIKQNCRPQVSIPANEFLVDQKLLLLFVRVTRRRLAFNNFRTALYYTSPAEATIGYSQSVAVIWGASISGPRVTTIGNNSLSISVFTQLRSRQMKKRIKCLSTLVSIILLL